MFEKKLTVALPEEALSELGGEQGVSRILAEAGNTRPTDIKVRPTGWSCCHDPEAIPAQFRPRGAQGWC